MLIKIQQTKSNFENLFEISTNGKLLFRAKAPWMKIKAPFDAGNIRQLLFSDQAGDTLYTTKYHVIENAIEESIPFKYLYADEQRFGQFEIIGKNGKEGAFYTSQKGIFDKKFCLEYKDKVYLGYSIDVGKRNVVSIFDGDTQIAQITKPLTVIENLDAYFMHLKDEYSSLVPILSFFTIYYDYRKYNNAGQLTKNSVVIEVGYSYDKNNSRYNPNWIAEQFGRQASEDLESYMRKIDEAGSAQAKKIGKLVALTFIALAIILLAVLLIIFIVLNQ